MPAYTDLNKHKWLETHFSIFLSSANHDVCIKDLNICILFTRSPYLVINCFELFEFTAYVQES